MAKKKEEDVRLFLIDGSSYIFRAFHAVRHLSTSGGLPTNAVFGYTNMLLKVIKDNRPTHLAVVFDTKEPTFRHGIYPEYKANRPEPPEDLIPQFEWVRTITRAFNVMALEKPGYEADDIIGTLARRAGERGLKTVIVTGDKDFYQVVSDRVTLLDTMKDAVVDAAKVAERFGVPPEGVVQVMGLAGDSTDNVPGIPGVGEKTAKKLIEQYGTIENVLANAREIKGKLGERVREHGEQALLSRRLVTIDTEVPLQWDIDDLLRREPDLEELERVLKELEFNKLLSMLPRRRPALDLDYGLILDEKALEELIARLRGAGAFAVDLETTSKSPTEAEIVGLSFSWTEGAARYIPVAHDYEGCPAQLPKARVLDALRPLLEDPSIPKIGQNIKYDAIVFAGEGVALAGIDFDTMVASYVLNPSRHNHNLDAISMEFLDRKLTSYKDVTGTGKSQIPFSEVELEAARDYACEDSEVAFGLYGLLAPRIREEGFEKLFGEIEMPLIGVLVDIERAGVAVDADLFARLSGESEETLERLQDEIYGEAGAEFNVNSPKQLQQILFEKLGLPPVKKTKSGFSTDVEVLEALADKHAICRLLVEYRQVSKLKSTYMDALPRLINPKTGRIHTSFNQTVTATGRLSSSDPNLQNIPVRTDQGRRIRQGFVAPPGSVLLSADYSQIELRILAHLSTDENLVDSFIAGEDIHERTARQIYGLLPGMVTPDMRRRAKTVNFGIIYGMSAFGLAKQLGIGRGEAAELIDQYFIQYPGVRAYLDTILNKAREDGYVTTLFDRRRYLPDINSTNNTVRSFAERTAINTPFQGSAADMIKVAMINTHRRLRSEGLASRMILQVHDELVLEAPEAEVDRATDLVRSEMEGVVELRVPLVVDASFGPTWADAH